MGWAACQPQLPRASLVNSQLLAKSHSARPIALPRPTLQCTVKQDETAQEMTWAVLELLLLLHNAKKSIRRVDNAAIDDDGAFVK